MPSTEACQSSPVSWCHFGCSVGWVWSGGEEELGVGGLGVVVEDVDEFAHRDVGEVAAFTVLPFLVLFLQDGSDQAGDAVTVGKDLDDVGAAFDLSVRRSIGLFDQTFCQCSRGSDANAVRSGSALSSMVVISENDARRLSVTW
jgi:hypothetical protein